MGNFTGKEHAHPVGDVNALENSKAESGPGAAFEFQQAHGSGGGGANISTLGGMGIHGSAADGMDVEVIVGGVATHQFSNQMNSQTEELVPTVFRWEHGGRQVYITGTFNNWEHQIPMHRSGNDFAYIHNLKKGKHAFKFIVDDEWRFAPDQPTVADIEGRINNFIDVSDFQAYTGDDDYLTEKQKVQDDVGETYSRIRPELDEYTKEPPPLPPHLRHIILNKVPPVKDAAALSVPQHVALNHLYCTAIKDGMMVLGVTQRYSEKFITTIFCKVPVPNS